MLRGRAGALVCGCRVLLGPAAAMGAPGLSEGTAREAVAPSAAMPAWTAVMDAPGLSEGTAAEPAAATPARTAVMDAPGLSEGTAGEPAAAPPAWTAPAGDASQMAPGTGDGAPGRESSQLPEGTGTTNVPTPRPRAIGRLHNYLGLAAGVDLTARRTDEPAGELGAVTGTGGVMARLAGYADRRGRSRGVLVVTVPELMLTLELGGTAARRDAAAAAAGLGPPRHGVAAGASGLANIGAGISSRGAVGIYGKLQLGQRFSARSNTDLEGAHYIASFGPGVGLRAAAMRRFTLLLGGAFDGVLGVQRFDRSSRSVAQLVPVVELAIYTQPRRDVYFAVLVRGDRTVVGQRYGGTRLHGRAAVEVVWQLRYGGRFRFAGLLLTYEGTRIDAGPGHPQFAAGGEQRGGQQLLLAGGVTI